MGCKVSIITPMFNAARYIRRTLDSIYQQTFGDFELIVVDDCSSDDSVRVVKNYIVEKNLNNLILMTENENQGVSCSRNLGLQKSSGQYICFLDSDDLFEPSMLQDLILCIEESRADIVIAGFEYFYEDNPLANFSLVPQEKGIYKNREFREKIFLDLYDRLLIHCVWNKLYRKSVLIENRIGFREHYQIREDLIFCMEALANSDRVAVLNKYYYHYVQHKIGESLVTKYNKNGCKVCIDCMDTFVSYYRTIDNASMLAEYDRRVLKQFLWFLNKTRKNRGLSRHEKWKEYMEFSKMGILKQLYHRTKPVEMKERLKVAIIVYRLYLVFFWF